MAAFVAAVVTAVQAAAAWVGSSFIAKTVFNIAASFLVSRLINKSATKSKSSQQGGRVQLPPQTNNKIPVLYGSAYINGIITDARLISTNNKTNNVMFYCLTLSEITNTGTIGVDSIYWNDVKLVFETTSGNEHKVLKGVKTVNTTDDYEDLNFKDGDNNLVQIRVYAGNSESAQQIYPQSGKVNAYDFWPSDGSNRKYWNDAEYGGKHGMQGLVFAIIRLEYNQEKGFTGLPNVTFKLNNTLKNPADVWYDYMTSKRYGAGIDEAQINTTALSSWRTYCDQYYNSSTSAWQNTAISGQLPRYQINGIVDTGNPVKNNIDQILQNSAAWMSYDISEGLWRVYPQAEQTSTLTFTDDNIVGGIALSSTNLEDLYNELEVEYCDTSNFDQRLYARDSIPLYDGSTAGTRHPNEPDNKLSMTLDLINNNVQALRVGRIQLKQTRDDLVITFTTAHVGLQAQAGDVINVVNSLYNWDTGTFASGKPFRITRVKEIETQDGALLSEITACEYNVDVYTEEPVAAFTPSENIGIAPIIDIVAPTTATIQTFENSIRPKITVTAAVPSGVVEGLEFWISYDTGLAESSRNYKLMRIERPGSGATFVTGASVEFDFDSLDSTNFVIKYRGFNRLGYGPFSTATTPTAFTPKPVSATIDVNTVLVDSSGTPVGDLTLPELLTKVSETFTAADTGKTLADKVFEEFTAKTGFDIVAAANDGSLGALVTPEAIPNINPSITLVSPTTADYLGGTVITLTGTKFNPTPQPGTTVSTTLLVNNVEITPSTLTDTSIVFTMPARLSYPSVNTIVVRVTIVNNNNDTTSTGTSGSVSVTSVLVEDLVTVATCPPTRSRSSYTVSEQDIIYRPYLGSCFISFKYPDAKMEQDLVKNSGTAKIYRADGTLYDTVDQDDIILYKNTMELPFKDREPGTDYYIILDRGIAKSQDGVLTPALDKNNTTWTFTTLLYGTVRCTRDNVFDPNSGNDGWDPDPPGAPTTNITPSVYKPETSFGFEVLEGVVKNTADVTGMQGPKLEISYLRQIKINTGDVLVKKYSTNELIATIPVTSGTMESTNKWSYPAIPDIEPNTRYKVELPSGLFTFVEDLKEIGVSSAFNWSFKTYPLAELISWTVDYDPVTDPNKLRVNRRSNVQLTFGRKIYQGFNDATLYTMTGSERLIGLTNTVASGANIRLYKKENDRLVEQLDLSKTFASDKVGVLYKSDLPGRYTVNFSHSFDCDTEYYLLFNNLVYDQYWEQNTGTLTNEDTVTWTTDGVKLCHVGHDMDIEHGKFVVGFDSVVRPDKGVLRIIDETTGLVVNELRADDWSCYAYNQMGTNGLVYDFIKDEKE